MRSTRPFLSFGCVLTCSALLVAAPARAGGGSVFVNDVNIDGLRDQTFEKVNVRIDAPGYSVKRVGVAAKEPVQPEATITKKYFLVTEQTVQGATEFDVDLLLNGKFVRTLSGNDPQVVSELTRLLRPGKNQIVLQATKKVATAGQPRSRSAAHLFRVIIGEGVVNQEQVVIEKQLVTFTRTAADMNDVTQEFTFTTR
jgi:hypothetical protein